MNLGEYLRISRARWKVILGTVVATTAIAALGTLATAPTYESSARLFFSTPQAEADVAFAGGEFSVARVASYADLVGTRQLGVRVVDRLGADATPSQVSDLVTATVTPGTANMQITAVDADPVLARNVAQATAVELAALVGDLETPPGVRQAPIKATVVDPATVSSTPLTPQPARNIALGVLLGLLLGLALAVAREVLDSTVREAEDVEAVGGPPVLGELVRASDDDRSLTAVSEGQGPYVESLRMLRTSLQYADADRTNRLVTVTSALSDEGKTTTAASLAIILARGDQRVLLMEADLRRPHLHKLLDLVPAVGLSTLLTGRIQLEEAVQGCGVRGLDVLTSGELPPDPAELLQSRAMADLLQRVREDYDVVVIDAPPLLPVTDAALLAARSDSALLVVRHGSTKRAQLRAALQRLRAVGGRPLGVVLNMTPSRLLASRYYTYATDQDRTLSLLEDPDTAARPSASGAVVTTVHIPEQSDATRRGEPGRNGLTTKVQVLPAGGPGAPKGDRGEVAEQRPEGVRNQVDGLRRPPGEQEGLGKLDEDRAGKPGRKPGRPAPLRPERRPKKA